MMALEYNGQRIGAMQYNGVTIGEAMMDGQIVYRSVIRVTPQAPTFLAASPWVTLPTVEGVTYSVSGAPGYSQTVTVTATAQAGYELVGTASWTHTYSSFYPVSGSWTKTTPGGLNNVIVVTHTAVESGTFAINMTCSPISISVYLYRNGTLLEGNTSGTAGNWQVHLNVGDEVIFSIASYSSVSYSGTWSISKN